MLALALALAAQPHPSSYSVSRVRVEGPRVSVELECQSRSLAEALPVDRDGDGRLDAEELAAGRAAIAAYALERYTLRVGSGGAAEAGRALPGRLVALSAELDDDPFRPEQWVTLELAFDGAGSPDRVGADRAIPELLIQVRLFAEENPWHFDTCELQWGAEPPQTFLFGIDGESCWFRPAAARRPGVFGAFFRLGLEHIATGYDHLAFLAALLLAARRLGSVVWVVTAFTAAHSLTLGAAALGWVHVPGSLVELSIAMSIAYVGALNLLARVPSSRASEAFVFGLVHGLGFASFLGEALRSEPLVVTALCGFNLGVEAGQLVAIAALAVLALALPGDRTHGADARAWLAARWLRLSGSLAVALFGSYWFLERAGWLPVGGAA